MLLADINGDGLMDPVVFADSGVAGGLVAGPIPDLLTQVIDGVGLTYTVTYQPLSVGAPLYTDSNQLSSNPAVVSAQAHYAPKIPIGNATANYYPNRQVGGDALAVVSGYTVGNSAAINASPVSFQYGYTYSNASFNLEGRGWLGSAR